MKQLLLGDHAVARGAYEAGVKVAAAYPGTPSTEVTEEISKYKEIYCEWSCNEKVALEVGLGAAIAGIRAIVSMKHVGLNVAADTLFTAAYTGVNAGLVIVVADDPGMYSSQNEQDTRLIAKAAKLPVLEPSDSNEALKFTKTAFEISEKFDTPVILRLTTRVAHSQSFVETSERKEQPAKEYVKSAAKYVMMPANARRRHVIAEERLKKLQEFAETFEYNVTEGFPKKQAVVCAGITYQYIKEAMPGANIFKLGMVYPLPVNALKKFAKKAKDLIVCEELDPFIEENLKANGIECRGKDIFPLCGDFSANLVAEKLAGKAAPKTGDTGLPQRPPVLCAGCPHRAVFYTLNKLKLNVFGDIGCYTLGANPPLNAIDTVVCMGASIGMACGAERKDFKNVAVIGDSTFIHSGIPPLINAVYNKNRIIAVILDNGTTGMTGHQHHPATGKNIRGEEAPSVNLEKLCAACGVKNVITVDPFDVDKLESCIKEQLLINEVSVIIAKSPCVLLEKKKYNGFEVKNTCRKCGVCAKLGCPAVVNKKDKYEIDKSLCVECNLCKKICKFNAIN